MLKEPDLVATSILHALDVVESAARPVLDTLKQALRPRRILLILDNFEQVMGAAPMIGELLSECPDLKALVTSRMPLRLVGEQEFPVPPLAVPDLDHPASVDELWNFPAVQLFVERAQAVRPRFTLTEENAAAVARLCSQDWPDAECDHLGP